MKLLLDTHAFIWVDTAPEKLSAAALKACQNPENTLCLSVASVWEMLIKQRLGKLTLDIALKEMLDLQQEINQLRVLPIELSID